MCIYIYIYIYIIVYIYTYVCIYIYIYTYIYIYIYVYRPIGLMSVVDVVVNVVVVDDMIVVVDVVVSAVDVVVNVVVRRRTPPRHRPRVVGAHELRLALERGAQRQRGAGRGAPHRALAILREPVGAARGPRLLRRAVREGGPPAVSEPAAGLRGLQPTTTTITISIMIMIIIIIIIIIIIATDTFNSTIINTITY